MQFCSFALLLAVFLPASVLAQAQEACLPASLPAAVREVATVRHRLHEQAVPEDDPTVPAAVAADLLRMKDGLEAAARAAFACASPNAAPQQLEETLASALHANAAAEADPLTEVRGKKEVGAYGSGFVVQVFALYGSPKYYEVDFRYGLECGDDNLLLVFTSSSRSDGAQATASSDGTHEPAKLQRWRPVLRWDAKGYTSSSDAFGDFVLMTPLSGFAGDRSWRFVVAHGQPACRATDGGSQFDLDILQPTADAEHPQAVWHLQQPYRRNQVPRLSTTEDTLTFELTYPPAPAGSSTTAPGPDVYRYRIGRDNHVESLSPQLPAAGERSPSTAHTHSPQ